MPQTIKVDGQIISSPQKICNQMNQHFATIGEKLAAKSTNPAQNYNHFKFFGKRNPSSIVLQPTDVYEIVEIISSLNDHKSPGYLDIPIRIIKESKYIIAGYLADSFNECIESGNYPDILKIAQVFPLHKGGSVLDLGNYRLISILFPINKVFETILRKRFSKFWDKYNLFANCQFGFRKKHSTNNAITYLNELILTELDQNKTVCGIFLDFAKAFDCVNHQILLDKLEYQGVRGNAYKLLNSYLSNRSQCTVNKEERISSGLQPISIGVPQGSVLGPFLFLVYINDLTNSCESKTILYADDSVLLCSDVSTEKLKSKYEKSFLQLENWICSNRLTLNYSKTNCVLFSNVKNLSNYDFCISTPNGPLPNNSAVKYLGVIIDHRLTWKEHARHVVQKLSTARGILCKLRHHAPQSVLLNVYYSIVYPYLYYGVTSWGCTAAKYTHRIQIEQNYIVKIITKLPFVKTKIAPLYDQLDLLRLIDIYKLEVLKFMLSFKKNSSKML